MIGHQSKRPKPISSSDSSFSASVISGNDTVEDRGHLTFFLLFFLFRCFFGSGTTTSCYCSSCCRSRCTTTRPNVQKEILDIFALECLFHELARPSRIGFCVARLTFANNVAQIGSTSLTPAALISVVSLSAW